MKKQFACVLFLLLLLSCNYFGSHMFNEHTPISSISGPNSGITNQEITITAKDSFDLDQNNFAYLLYGWKISGPSETKIIQRDISNPDFIFSTDVEGEYIISVSVSDGKNESETLSKTVLIRSDKVLPMLVNNDSTPEFRFCCETDLFSEFSIQISQDPEFKSISHEQVNITEYQFEYPTELIVGQTYYLRARGLANDGKTWSSWDYLTPEFTIRL